MADMDKLLRAEYDIIVALWELERKYITKIPLSPDEWRALTVEGNKLAEKREGEAQDILLKAIMAVMDAIAFIDRKVREKEGKSDE